MALTFYVGFRFELIKDPLKTKKRVMLTTVYLVPINDAFPEFFIVSVPLFMSIELEKAAGDSEPAGKVRVMVHWESEMFADSPKDEARLFLRDMFPPTHRVSAVGGRQRETSLSVQSLRWHR